MDNTEKKAKREHIPWDEAKNIFLLQNYMALEIQKAGHGASVSSHHIARLHLGCEQRFYFVVLFMHRQEKFPHAGHRLLNVTTVTPRSHSQTAWYTPVRNATRTLKT
jgi:hypothetical protein